MTTSELYRPPRPTISYELYPPRTPKGEAQVWETITRLAEGDADYFSVTYGASGSTAERSQALVARILAETTVPVIAHLTCVGRSRAELRAVVEAFLDAGVRDFLALRGDAPQGETEWTPAPDGFSRASDLVELIREVEAERFGARASSGLARLVAHRGQHPRVSIAVAAYPGYETSAAVAAGEDPAVGGAEAGAVGAAPATRRYACRADELAALRAKQDAGADFAITQLFFDAEAYRELQQAAREAGVTIPLVPGILPLTDPARVRKLCALNDIPEPTALLAELDAAATRDEATRIGLRATARLAREVLEAGAPGLHLYTFNQHGGVSALLDEVLAPA
ncbi:5,10-methylenetetrahydrofolate reductase [Salana multivorans]|uniref:Methylenetetrahydrofolate reductase n=1 Tax=Salana multivorans TaxID=120377 RepID=A0A3N2D9K2_9MICO|nr:methylenetetrahydrofolate reductase [Salana multivorans]ROR96470.1 5,10-methylenetetrahydrofolate reductase [Salana multivorans]